MEQISREVCILIELLVHQHKVNYAFVKLTWSYVSFLDNTLK